MIISNAKKTTETDWVFDLSLTNDEVEYLVNLSVHALIQGGGIPLVEQEEEQEIPLPSGRYSNSTSIQ